MIYYIHKAKSERRMNKMKVNGTINTEVEVTEKEMVETMLANLLKTDKWKVRNMIITEMEFEGEYGLYEEYDGNYSGTPYSLITNDPKKIKKYNLLKELLETVTSE